MLHTSAEALDRFQTEERAEGEEEKDEKRQKKSDRKGFFFSKKRC